ncbi:MAG: cysteine desulfurase [Theionarchaea archaeon]|nr:cysteine desulfurase [Theionarchaea archaeon]MBU7037073.1 cysteine desulfurase [Theionarchaea archaeon]
MRIPDEVRADIPLTRKVAYLDNAATSLTPAPVVEAVVRYYMEYKGNVHRGVHSLSEEASRAFHEAREKVAHFINASPEEVVFVGNTTEALNCVALGLTFDPGDIVVTTELEHHSNFLPFLRLQNRGVTMKVLEAVPPGVLDGEQMEKIQGAHLVTCSMISNAMGTVLPVQEIGAAARKEGALFCVDAAQAAGHVPLDVRKLGCDFLAFSGHKGPMGPTGIGVLFMKERVQNQMEPCFLGGGAVKDVSLSGYQLADVPHGFEPGTPNIAGAIGLGAALDYIRKIGISHVQKQEALLTRLTVDEFSSIPHVTWYGSRELETHAGVISFTVEGMNSHDVASILDTHGIMVRSGHHCALPIMKKLCIPGTVRASYHCYNTVQEVELMVDIVREVSRTLAG